MAKNIDSMLKKLSRQLPKNSPKPQSNPARLVESMKSRDFNVPLMSGGDYEYWGTDMDPREKKAVWKLDSMILDNIRRLQADDEFKNLGGALQSLSVSNDVRHNHTNYNELNHKVWHDLISGSVGVEHFGDPKFPKAQPWLQGTKGMATIPKEKLFRDPVTKEVRTTKIHSPGLFIDNPTCPDPALYNKYWDKTGIDIHDSMFKPLVDVKLKSINPNYEPNDTKGYRFWSKFAEEHPELLEKIK